MLIYRHDTCSGLQWFISVWTSFRIFLTQSNNFRDRFDSLPVNDRHADRHTHTQATTIPEGQNWLWVKIQGQGKVCGHTVCSITYPFIDSHPLRAIPFVQSQRGPRFSILYCYFKNEIKIPKARSWMKSNVQIARWASHPFDALPFATRQSGQSFLRYGQ